MHVSFHGFTPAIYIVTTKLDKSSALCDNYQKLVARLNSQNEELANARKLMVVEEAEKRYNLLPVCAYSLEVFFNELAMLLQ